jgi:hemerythrin-like domain-containing protein
MTFSRRTAQLLHEDHRATIGVIEELDRLLSAHRRKVPDASDPHVSRILALAAGALEDEVNRHFDFEEKELFTRLEEMGDVAIGEHLRGEHRALSPLGQRVAELAREAQAEGFSDAGWTEFRAAASELVERMLVHIQKEEMALIPALEDLLDAETDMQLSAAYSEGH